MVRRTYRTTTHRNGGLLSRLRGRRENITTTTTTTTKTKTIRKKRNPHEPVHHHHRRPSIRDKISGTFMKLEGTLRRRPGLKVSISVMNERTCIRVRRLTIISRRLAPGECMELMGDFHVELIDISKHLVSMTAGDGLWQLIRPFYPRWK